MCRNDAVPARANVRCMRCPAFPLAAMLMTAVASKQGHAFRVAMLLHQQPGARGSQQEPWQGGMGRSGVVASRGFVRREWSKIVRFMPVAKASHLLLRHHAVRSACTEGLHAVAYATWMRGLPRARRQKAPSVRFNLKLHAVVPVSCSTL